jgi:hypothetical protein
LFASTQVRLKKNAEEEQAAFRDEWNQLAEQIQIQRNNNEILLRSPEKKIKEESSMPLPLVSLSRCFCFLIDFVSFSQSDQNALQKHKTTVCCQFPAVAAPWIASLAIRMLSPKFVRCVSCFAFVLSFSPL